jgi:uncharacterized membrane protein YGL010W
LPTVSPWLNWATITIALAVVYYFTLSFTLGIGAAIGLSILAYIVSWLDTLAWPLWLTCLLIFTAGWIGQFIGHAIEGKRPSFMEDIQFLLIGPLWLMGQPVSKAGQSPTDFRARASIIARMLNPIDLYDVRSLLTEDERMVQDLRRPIRRRESAAHHPGRFREPSLPQRI